MIRTQNLRFTYPRSDSLHFPDISCQEGEVLLILGGSGKGKTTLLQLLAGLRRPQEGQVWIGKNNIASMNARALDRFRGKHIGLVFQQSRFISSLSVKENLLLTQGLAGLQTDLSRITYLLSRLGLEQKLEKKPQLLSVGEQQRVAIARAVLNKPRLILADEPTSALDDENCEEVLQLLRHQAQEDNAALVIVTHDKRLKDRVEKRIEM